MNYWYLAAAALSLFGFGLCLHIVQKKRQPKPMVCMLGADCNKVVKSEFSTFLGVGLEYWGITYYALSAAYYLFVGLVGPVPVELTFTGTGVAFAALLFSCYLTFVQAFYIKSWCSWCLTSAANTAVVFMLAVGAVVASGVDFVPLLVAWREPIVAFHLLGFALGIGGATVADLVFFRFMRDFHISPSERDVIRMLSQALWLGLLVVVVSEAALFIPAEAGATPFFWPEMALLAVIAITNAALGLVVMPRLVDAASNRQVLRVAEVARLRCLAFALGSVSFVTWYAAFAASVRGESSAVDAATFFAWYLAALVGAIVLSQVIERRYHELPAPAASF